MFMLTYQECTYASVSPQATIPPSYIITPYRPDMMIHNKSTNAVRADVSFGL